MEKYTLLNGDCMQLLNDVPRASIDCIIADLPYGQTDNKWDSVLPLDDLFKQYRRIIKPNGAILLFGNGLFTANLITTGRTLFRYNLIWKKGGAPTGFLNAKKMPLRQFETISVFYKHLPTYNPQYTEGKPYKEKQHGFTSNYSKTKLTPTTNTTGKRYPTDVLEFMKCNQTTNHPTEKPVDLLKWLIKTYTNSGDLVLDNTMGSGSCGVAALELGRRFIGIELDENYYTIAQNRIKSAVA